MKKALFILASIALGCVIRADDTDYARRIPCELQTAGSVSLQPLELMQGSSPLIAADQYRSGRAITVTNDTIAYFRFAPSSTNAYWVSTSNTSYSGNSFYIQLPSIGTNATGWVYTVVYEKNGNIYWTGSGRLTITPSTVTGNQLSWQVIQGCVTTNTVNSLIATHNASTASHPDKLSTNRTVTINGLTKFVNDDPEFTVTATKAETVTGAQSNLIATAWQNSGWVAMYEYTENAFDVVITKALVGFETMYIPEMINGKPVRELAGYYKTDVDAVVGVFYDYYTIKNVFAPSVSRLGNRAFYMCSSVEKIHIENVESINPTNLFRDCTSLNSVYWSKNNTSPEDYLFVAIPANQVTNYVANPTATGWGSTFGGMPVVRMPIESDSVNAGTVISITSTTTGTNTSGFFAGNGGGLTNVNASTLAGYNIDEIMGVGATYYFSTNEITYGAVTGRIATLTAPTDMSTITYPGPVADGTHFASYLIGSNEMPAVLQKGVYSFKFRGGHTASPSKDPTIMGDLYVKNAATGATVQEFESQPPYTVIPYGSEDFYITINITNDVAKDGYAFQLKTKLVDSDGYTGAYTSSFGPPTYAGFTFPKVNGLYVLKSEYDTAGLITNRQQGVTLGLASGSTVATATTGNEPVTLDQALSLLSSSSTVYLSPVPFAGGTVGVTNRTLAASYSNTAWTVVYNGSVTAGQYLFSFTAPSNLVTAIMAGNQTANIYMTYAGGGSSTLTCKMEGYIFDPNTTNSTEYAETSGTFAPAKSGTLPTTPFTPIAVIPYPTNLTGNIRYQIRIKAITANNVTSVTMWGGGTSISSVSFPVSDSVALGARGATAIESADGVAGTYDISARKLTMPRLQIPYSPFSSTITPANGTATVNYAAGNMPSLTLSTATVLTLDPTGYDTNGVSRIALSVWTGTNSLTLATNIITYATAPTISTNCWNTIFIRRVSNCIWKGVGL